MGGVQSVSSSSVEVILSHFEAEFVPLLARNYEGGGKAVKPQGLKSQRC